MTIIALERVALINPVPDMGDRNIQGISTPISNAEWLLEADFSNGSIGDVTLYRNTSVNTKGAEPTWEWFAGIPAANIKAYKLAGELPKPATVKASNGESQAKNPTAGAQGAGTAAKR